MQMALLFVPGVCASLVALWVLDDQGRRLVLMGLESFGVLVAVMQIEAGGNYIAWNLVALLLTGRFAWHLRAFRKDSRLATDRERYLLRALFYDTLPQLLWRNPRRLSLWRQPA